MQTQEVQARVQKELSRGQNRCVETTPSETSTVRTESVLRCVLDPMETRFPATNPSATDTPGGGTRPNPQRLPFLASKGDSSAGLEATTTVPERTTKPNETRSDTILSDAGNRTLRRTDDEMRFRFSRRALLRAEAERTDCATQGTSTDLSTMYTCVMHARTTDETPAGKLCIEVEPTSKLAWISEELCIGCGICVKKCPFEAIQIINLPKDLDKETTHRYGPNSFKLHRLPTPRPGQVLGLVGTNGIGKSTALKILSGKIKPNLGRFENPPDWQEILTYFRGSELQNYFTKMLEDDIKAIMKPQYVDHIPKAVRGNVLKVLEQRSERREAMGQLMKDLDLEQVTDRNVEDLSGGELQRFAIAVIGVQVADVYMIDEPSSYLDVRQRLKAGEVIRGLLEPTKFVIVVEHDLAVLDYLSDFICCLYGKPGAYGVVTLPFSVREGINIFLAGFVPTENLRFREEALSFKVSEGNLEEEGVKHFKRFTYPSMERTQGNFNLQVEEGDFSDSEIIVMMGENGTGKTTFIRMLAGVLRPDDELRTEVPEFNVSYKPQKISPKFTSTVRNLLHKKIRESYLHPQFITDVIKPLRMEELMDQEVQNLSGGELQRVAITLCLGQPADIYLIDEPSAYLDSEQRIVAAKVIKRFILHSKKTAFIVEHDFIMATYLADRVIVYEGEPSKKAVARTPQSLVTGLNLFLKNLEITFRRDPTNYRPRINKKHSTKDREQKDSGAYYYLED